MLIIWISFHFIYLVCFIYSIFHKGANKLFFNLVKYITSIPSGWSVLDFTDVAKFVEIIYQIFKSFKGLNSY